jgi:hypothetical protein
MRRLMALLGLALAAYAILPAAAQAQVVIVGRPAYYQQPVIVSQSYYPPVVTYSAPPVVYSSPQVVYSAPQVVYSAPQVVYSAPQVVYSAPQVSYYAAPQSVVTYSAPVTYAAPAAGVYTTRTYYGYGILRPRGYYSQTYYQP